MTKHLNNTGQQGEMREIGQVVEKMELLITPRCKDVGMVSLNSEWGLFDLQINWEDFEVSDVKYA